MAEADILDQMPPAGIGNETDDERKARLARLPLPNAPPAAPVDAAQPQPVPAKAIMPPAPVAAPQPPPMANAAPSAMPPAPAGSGSPIATPPFVQGQAMPPAGTGPAQKNYEALQAQGAPKLPWWKQALDIVGSLHPLGRMVESEIPGTPQNYSARLNQAAIRAAKEQELEGGKQTLEKGRQEQATRQQEAAMVDVPGHPELGKVEQKSLPALIKQIEANEGKTDTADVNQKGATEREQMKIDAKPATATGLKLGVLKPDILAQVGPMPDDPAAQAEWGKKYDELAGKGNMRTGVGTYAMVRLLDWATKYNPDLLKMMPEILKGAGLTVPPGVSTGIPAGLPMNEAGQVIGTATPGAPTSQTRTAGQAAQRVLTEMPRVRKEVGDLAGYLGPGEGRLNVGFLLGKVGSTGDPHKDQVLSQLRTDLVFMHSAAAKFHINSVKAIDDFEKTAEAGKDSAPALQGALDSIEPWAKTAAKQGRGEASNAEVQVHQGYEYTKGSDGLWHKGNKAQ